MSDIQQVAVFEEQLTQLSRFKDGNAFCNVVYSYIKKVNWFNLKIRFVILFH